MQDGRGVDMSINLSCRGNIKISQNAKCKHVYSGIIKGYTFSFAVSTLQGFIGEPHSAENSSVVSHSLC